MQEGLLDIGDNHQLHYTRWGHRRGTPVLFLHGGPGLGTSEQDTRFFDLKRTDVVLYDQRSCDKSTPLGSLQHNTTQHLIADINRLLDHLQIEKAILFGGSWGSTLALCYAIEYPERVKALVLRGPFTADRAARHFFEQGGTAAFFPAVWERFVAKVPSSAKADVGGYYFQQILESEETASRSYAYELMYYGLCLSRIGMTATRAAEIMQHMDYRTQARILAHYSVHHFFIPERYIWQHLDRIAAVSIHIVQGRYDMICLPQSAYQLHRHLPKSELYLVDAGHAAGEPEIEEALRRVMGKLTA